MPRAENRQLFAVRRRLYNMTSPSASYAPTRERYLVPTATSQALQLAIVLTIA
jgi:hypothetical protein